MIEQALRKEPLTVYGDGKQTRSFQFVSDLVSPLLSPLKERFNIVLQLANTNIFYSIVSLIQLKIDSYFLVEKRNTNKRQIW